MTATLTEMMRSSGGLSDRWLRSVDAASSLDALLSGDGVTVTRDRLRDRSILIATESQFETARAMMTCDGLARRMVICPPGLSDEQRATIADTADIDLVLRDDADHGPSLPGIEALALCGSQALPPDGRRTDGMAAVEPADRPSTEWILPTSGTSGPPKIVKHTLHTLVGAMAGGSLGIDAVWSTFYDIRRYGGLQIFLRAMIGGGSLILSDPAEATTAFLARAGSHGTTHISGTPSHWRRVVMSPPGDGFAPDYVRLSGEIADQAILDALRARYPDAVVSHAFASTEAGVAFDVVDGLAGFPAHLVGSDTGVVMRIEDGSLRIKSARIALHYLGDGAPPVSDADGFVDTGDMVERRRDRYHFVGRRSGVINVGGLKIHPEEVEAVIAEHGRVRMCIVKARKSPITGAVVAAEIVADFGPTPPQPTEVKALEGEIVALCRRRLERHKVPASIRFVPALDIAVSGKMRR